MMKFIVALSFALCASVFVYAQVGTTPEVPRNYKPKPKGLLPMPDTVMENTIFPVLGRYEVMDKSGQSTTIYIRPDSIKKGIIWISGLQEGMFKAYLKESPGTYKIPAQPTLANDSIVRAVDMAEKQSGKMSGKSVSEGTLLYDIDAQTVRINLGKKFDEEDPASVFSVIDATGTQGAPMPVKRKSKKTTDKSITYTGTKI